MITVGYSTRELDNSYKEHISETIGVEHEIIHYENNGQYSLTEIYNKILEKAKYECVVLIHDDLIFNQNEWGKVVLEELEDILGLAGTSYIDNECVWWKYRHFNTGTVKHVQPNGEITKRQFSINNGKKNNVAVIDGLFIALYKNKVNKFNEDIKGFHFYDISFCLDNTDKTIEVTNSIDVTHKSIGGVNEEWKKNKEIVSEIYKDKLPLKKSTKLSYLKRNIKLTSTPKVSVIIPSKNNFDVLKTCLDSFEKHNTYDNLEIIIADTGSDSDVKAKLYAYINKKNTRVIEYDYYNFAKINNDVVVNHLSDDTELILFCNDDVELINDALSENVDLYNRNIENVGTLGSRLHYPNGTIQHSGIVCHVNQTKDRFILTHHGQHSYNSYFNKPNRVIGNTGAFLLVNKDLFIEVGMFNTNYLDCFEDVELNISILKKGKVNIFNGNSVLFHHESLSRKKNFKKEILEKDTERINIYIKENLFNESNSINQ